MVHLFSCKCHSEPNFILYAFQVISQLIFALPSFSAYGFIPCLQPSAATDGFARIYAAYGGFFIVMSFLIGWALEGESAKPDIGDLVGGLISVVGALVIVFWPRR